MFWFFFSRLFNLHFRLTNSVHHFAHRFCSKKDNEPSSVIWLKSGVKKKMNQNEYIQNENESINKDTIQQDGRCKNAPECVFCHFCSHQLDITITLYALTHTVTTTNIWSMFCLTFSFFKLKYKSYQTSFGGNCLGQAYIQLNTVCSTMYMYLHFFVRLFRSLFSIYGQT